MNIIMLDDKRITISEGNLQDFHNYYSDNVSLKNEFVSMVTNGVLILFSPHAMVK